MKKILTIDIGASKIRIQVVNELGVFGAERLINVVGLGLDNKILKQFLIENIKPFIDGEAGAEILAVSIGAPGRVDSDKKIIKHLPNIRNVENLSLVEELGNVFNLPIFLLNDADAGGLGEGWLGSGKIFKDIIYLTLGTGVGSGIIKNGEIQQGSELGHTLLTIEGENRLCSCGEVNCAETFLGTKGLSGIYAKIFEIEPVSLDDGGRYKISPRIKNGVKTGDEKCLDVRDEYAGYLALFLKNIISNYKTEAIILGGGIAYDNEPLLEEVKKKIGTETKILLGQFENAVNLGLAKYALDNLE